MKHLLLTSLLFCLACSGNVAFSQCKGIDKKVDKFSGETRIYTTINSPLIINAVISPSGESRYFLDLTAPASPNAKRYGVTVLFSDGSKSDWPEAKVETEVGSPRFSGWGYTHAKTFIEVQKEDLLKYSQVRITDYKLYVYPLELREKIAEKFMKDVGCLLTEIQAIKKNKQQSVTSH